MSGPAAGAVVAGARALTVSGGGATLGLALTAFGLGLAGVGVLISGLAIFSWLVDDEALVGACGSVTGALLWSGCGAVDGVGTGGADKGAGCGSLTA